MLRNARSCYSHLGHGTVSGLCSFAEHEIIQRGNPMPKKLTFVMSEFTLWLKIISIVSIMSLLVLMTAQPAYASNFSGPYADNGDHYYAYVNLEHYTITAANWGRDRIDATDMTTHNDGSCKSGTDVCIYDYDYTGEVWDTVYGRAYCDTRIGNGKCDRFLVVYDSGNLIRYRSNWLKRAGCHEWGHTVGLDHFNQVGGDYSCMWTNINNRYQSTYFAGHEVNHINNRY